MNLALLGGALGGIGLFLLGMNLMTGGLKVAAGAMLRDILANWTRTHVRGLLSGILITGVVQSSSAVTVAAIGFVNAGVLNLGQAIWVIFGSNVGTTMTGWIVAFVGFDFKIEAYALPLLGIGMFLSLTGTATRRGALGEAIAGFGAIFLGIATLKATFAGLGQDVDLGDFVGGGLLSGALFFAVGFVLTTLMQSSSAVIAIALTAAVGGVLTIEAGAAVVIGANVGTTTTAMLAVLGATPNARRVALSHVAFNVLTGAVALALLPLMLLAVQGLERTLDVIPGPATTLALFHTVFNILGVLIMWPLAGRLETWLATRFVTVEEDESRPRFLDNNSLEVPALAANAILLELRRVADIALGIARDGFIDPAARPERLWRRNAVVGHLSAAIVGYIQRLNAAKTSVPIAEALAHPIRALWHFAEIADLGLATAGRRPRIAELPPVCRDQLAGFATLIAGHIDAAQRAFADPTVPPPDGAGVEPAYQRVKGEVLAATSSGALKADEAEIALETLTDLHAVVRLLDRAARRVAAIAAVVQIANGDGAPNPADQEPGAAADVFAPRD